MSQRTAFTQLREQAIALRRAGRSRREIKELLAITSNETLNEALKGEPPQPGTWRPNAKDDLRAKARELTLTSPTGSRRIHAAKALEPQPRSVS